MLVADEDEINLVQEGEAGFLFPSSHLSSYRLNHRGEADARAL